MSADVDRPARSTIKLNPAQVAVLEWIQSGCPGGVYPKDSYTHRITARALASRGLVRISGHGTSWRAEPTERGRVWPEPTEEDERVAAASRTSNELVAVTVDDKDVAATARAMRRIRTKDSGKA